MDPNLPIPPAVAALYDEDAPLEHPQRYLVVIRPPERGESYWCEGEIRVATGGGLELPDDECDPQPVIVTDANEGKLLTLGIEMRALLAYFDQLSTAEFERQARALVRRFDEWEPS